MSWFNKRYEHSLASRGVSTKMNYHDLKHELYTKRIQLINKYIDNLSISEKIDLYIHYVNLDDNPEDKIYELGLDKNQHFIKHIENVIYNFINCKIYAEEKYALVNSPSLRNDKIYNECYLQTINTDNEVYGLYKNYIDYYDFEPEIPKLPEDIEMYVIRNRKEV